MSSATPDFQAFFGRPRDLDQGLVSSGRETGWMNSVKFRHEESHLVIADALCIAGENLALTLDLAPGDYQLWVKGIDYGFERRLSRMRCCSDADDLELGGKIGDVGTDSAMLGLCDLGSLLRSCGGDRAEIGRLVSERVFEVGWVGLVRLENVSFPVFHAGFGDGVFPVYELLSKGRRAGTEIEFISAAAEYPKTLYWAAMQERIYRSKRT